KSKSLHLLYKHPHRITEATIGLSSGDNIEQKETELSKKEGETASLECTFSTSSTNYLIYWYRQYPGAALQFLLYSGSGTVQQRFSSNADRSSGKAPLSISNVQLGDSAVYYCALRTTVIH
uniref:Ig-like domain-containing protein n=1 Tax=Paramormyrops kingsleyae TaxID=1676925 RepID=A0A3B3Q5Y2_9TELE